MCTEKPTRAYGPFWGRFYAIHSGKWLAGVEREPSGVFFQVKADAAEGLGEMHLHRVFRES